MKKKLAIFIGLVIPFYSYATSNDLASLMGYDHPNPPPRVVIQSSLFDYPPRFVEIYQRHTITEPPTNFFQQS